MVSKGPLVVIRKDVEVLLQGFFHEVKYYW